MAGTADDHNTLDQLSEWLLITTALDLVARYMPREAATEFLLNGLSATKRAERICWRYQGKAQFSGHAFPLEDYFWVRAPKVRHEITADGAVIRKGPALVQAKWARKPKGWKRFKPDEVPYVFDPQGRSTTVRLPLVQLHRDDILRRLRETGLLPAPKQQELTGTERFVFERMKSNPPRKGDHDYVRTQLYEPRPQEFAALDLKTFQNIASRYRKQFEIPAIPRESSRRSSRQPPRLSGKR
jgi:hypothetical protein